MGTFEATYERILNEKSSLGISTLYVFNNENSNEDVNFMLSPYYRRYFGKKTASGFERILNEKSSLGISTLYVFNNENSNEDVNFMLSPYYRRYFGKKTASGFFVEGFGMLSSIDGKKIYDKEDDSTFTKVQTL